MASPFDLSVPNIVRTFLPAIKWEPDRIGTGLNNILDAKNVWPHPDGYESIEHYGVVDSATGTPTTRVQTGIAVVDTGSEQEYVYIGTAAKLHGCAIGNPYSDLTGAVTAGPWAFTRYGTLVIATSTGGVAQKLTISGAGPYANLGGTPPQMKYACVIRDFLVFARSSANPNRIQWSALGDPENWTVSAATQSDFQDIPDEGPVEFVVGGQYGLIFFRNAVYRMSYIGSPAIFQFDKIAFGIGVAIFGTAGGYNQADRLGDNVYFNSRTGLAVVRSGQAVQPIMNNRASRYLFGDTNRNSFISQVACDPFRKLAVLAYSSNSLSSTTQMDRLIFYSETLDRLSRAEVTCECVFPAIIETIGGQDWPLEWTFTFFDTSHRHNALGGKSGGTGLVDIAPIVDTEERQFFPGRRAIVRDALPNVEPQTSITVAIGSRVTLDGSISRTSGLALNANGRAGFRKEGRYHSARITASAAGPNNGYIIRGVEVEAIMQGKR